jgi:small multidrug resistance family-3 protein
MTKIAVLLLAALLEAGGDALMRTALQSPGGSTRKIVLFFVGAVTLFAYGYCVNAPGWDFGRLLGVYVVFFFLVAQAIGYVFFHQTPAPSIYYGGVLIVLGGIVIARG